jgi:sensor c-di-GMP phosphodiesterase-like protein
MAPRNWQDGAEYALRLALGVETAEQITFLQARGCDEAQGYFFSKPVVAHEVANLLETDPGPFAPHASVSAPV